MKFGYLKFQVDVESGIDGNDGHPGQITNCRVHIGLGGVFLLTKNPEFVVQMQKNNLAL